MGDHAQEYINTRQNLLSQALDLLHGYAQGDILGKRALLAAQANPRLRCALPTNEVLTFAADSPKSSEQATILAADGSQIPPSRHDPFPFCVINVGVYQSLPNESPCEIQRTSLLTLEDVETQQGILSEGAVNLRRDLFERQMLAELASQQQQPVITLTDGPLELFSERRESIEFRESVKKYIESLQALEHIGAITAGYVDRPFSDLVVRLLELSLLPEEKFSQAGGVRPLLGVRDSMLFATFLQPGQRSAVFGIQSQQPNTPQSGLDLNFFYLNIGRPKHPSLARVETPRWVAQNPRLLAMLHGTLVDQCHKLGSQPYPYALLRAHEIALVSFDERKRIIDMLSGEYLQRGFVLEGPSNKQFGKDNLGDRRRYS